VTRGRLSRLRGASAPRREALQRGDVLGEQACEGLRARGHPETLGGWPVLDLRARELDPTLERLEHLDLEGCEEHRQVCPLREGVAVIEVGGHELDHGSVMDTDVVLELVEGTQDVRP
jgi:hypothetical protein